MSTSKGSRGSRNVSPADLNNMSPDEFNKHFKNSNTLGVPGKGSFTTKERKLSSKGVKQLVGGLK
jgi:hypothetical protein